MSESTEIVWREEAVSLEKPVAAYELSKSLKKIIVENNLYTPIKGKNYVNVEGWQIAGAFTGIYPRIRSVEKVETPSQEIKYRAEVSLFNLANGQTVGYGVAFCSNKEYSKRNFDEYAIASMAQTRAVSKAYRLTLGWLMKLAGYEATPSEEMAETENISESEFSRPWHGSGRPTDKQIGLLAYLLKGLGKSQGQIDKILAQARTQTQAVVSSWIDDARRRTEGASNKPIELNVQDVVDEEWEAMSADEKLAAISQPSFKAAVAEAEKADSIIDMQREREAEASERAMSARIDREQEREAGGW